MKKIEGEVKRFNAKKRGNKELAKFQYPQSLTKFFDKYIKIPIEEF
jgi:hypothetical protein